MKIALIAYGAMGKLIRALAEDHGHMIAAVVDETDAGASALQVAENSAGPMSK